MFVARTRELSKIEEIMKQPDCASLIYGKRRVGKTRLIKEALKKQDCAVIYYECIRGTVRDNVNAFVSVLRGMRVLTFDAVFQSFAEVFAFLNTLPRFFVVVIDEYPYLSAFADQEMIDSVFQNLIDQKLSNIHLVLSGSQISVMSSLLNKGNALYGRFQLILHLKELDYQDAALFYPSKTPYEKAAFYGVFGGSPFVLRELRDDETLEENIIRTVLNENSPVFLYASHILLTDHTNAAIAERILSVLGNGKKKYTEIERSLQTNSNGSLAKQLNSLQAAELISRVFPINRLDDSKKGFYEINDNLLRFWYTYVYRNKSALQMIGPGAFFDQTVSPTLLTEYVPRRFEELCRCYFSRMAKEGRLPGITNIGTYYYDDALRHRNGEFDVALAFGARYSIFEAKYYNKPLSLSEMRREAAQIREIRDLQVSGIGFIAVNGFERKEEPYICYDGDDLYEDRPAATE